MLKKVKEKGIGVIAINDIPKDTAISAYTGDLLPYKDNSDSEYGLEMAIGWSVPTVNSALTGRAYLDAARTGSVARFFNHSCDSNAGLFEARCGMGHRVISVGTYRDVKAGEEITIDYGWDDGQPWDFDCYCGEENCRFPPPPAPQEESEDGDYQDDDQRPRKRSRLT
ncbi:hypothetical protein NX059_009925 [Plenodomus lindquistii]|nr:hypothetical protein NX059_009925 [Plenodomus lindquistii]